MAEPKDLHPQDDLKDESRDKELGMDRGITRRDFLNGVAVTAGAATLPPHVLAALQHDLNPEKTSRLLSAGADRAARKPCGLV